MTDLPDYVYFNHSIHIAKGVGCESATAKSKRCRLPTRQKHDHAILPRL